MASSMIKIRAACGRSSRNAAAALLAGILAVSPVAAQARPLAPRAFLGLLDRAEDRSAARDWPAAALLWREIVAANPVEGRYWERLATALFRAGDYRAAIPAYEKSVELGSGRPANNVYNIACAYALLGDRDKAFAALEKALAMGFLNLDGLRADPDLASLRDDPRFARLVPVPPNPAALSREEGWRQDLRFLLWQIDRIGADPYRLHPRSWFEQKFETLVESAPRLTDLQMALDLLVIMRGVGDGHSGLMRGNTADWALSLPLQFQAFEEGVFITAADPAHRDLLGGRLAAIGGHSAEQVMAALAEGVSRDNEGPWIQVQSASRLRYTALLAAAGLIPEKDGATLSLVMPDGRRREVRVAADMSQPDIWNSKPNPEGWVNLGQTRPGPAPLYLRDPGKNYWFEYLPDSRTVYFAFNTIRDDKGESLAAFSNRLAAAIAASPVDRLVIDLRWNNGGNTQLLPPLLAAILRSDKINRKGRLFVLIGGRTVSAAQNAAALLDRFTEASFVGEPTGSSPNFVGEEEPFTLPYSKLVVNISYLAWQSSYPQDRRTWIAPELYVPPTFAAYLAKRDPALEAILELPIPPD
jgi:tetratricopeptide (TPR) repeat protein